MAASSPNSPQLLSPMGWSMEASHAPTADRSAWQLWPVPPQARRTASTATRSG
jgi:hypothetical protein